MSKKNYTPSNSSSIQLDSLLNFMNMIHYQPHTQLGRFVNDQGNVITLNTAIRLHNELHWASFKKRSNKYVCPLFNPEIKLERYNVNIALAAKLVQQVKLGIVGDQLVVFDHRVKFTHWQYEKAYLNKFTK